MSLTESSQTISEQIKQRRLRGAGIWRLALLCGATLIILLSAFAAMRVSAARSLPEGEKIVPGVKVADISVGGLSESEAMEKVRTWAKGRMQKPVTLIAPVSNRKWNLTLGECGGRFDSAAAVQEALTVGRGETIWEQLTLADSPRNKVITPKFALDENQLEKRLREIDRKVRVPARNVRIRLSGGVVKILASERNGIRVDIPSTKSALLNGDPQNLRDGGTAKLVIREEKPQITTTDVRKIDTLLASYRTDYSSSIPGRKHNVEMAIDRLNAALVADGDVFSYNDQIGERTESEGWQNAKMYKDGTVVDGMGAGICQVSSTLYNVALRADLPIVERAPHSLPVHYVPPGRDATVVYGATDFRFRNTTGGPIYISSSRDSGDVVIGIWGKKPTNPRRVRLITDSLENLPDGGYRSKTYKEVTDSQGRVRREFLSTDTYHAPKPTPESDGKPTTRR